MNNLPRICPVNIWTAFAVDLRFGRQVYIVMLTISAQLTHPPIIPSKDLYFIQFILILLAPESNQTFKVKI